MQEHQALLHKVCNLYCVSLQDKEDLFQEIVIQVWKSYPTFRGDAKFSTWLYRIALNTAISNLRKQKNRVFTTKSAVFPADLPAPIQDTGQEEQLQQLYAAIGQLTEVEKALVMLYLDDKTYEEMEEILGINQNNLRVKMNRIKEKLRKLTKEEDEYGTGKP